MINAGGQDGNDESRVRLCYSEKPFGVLRKYIRFIRFADFRRLHFLQRRTMFVACRMRIKQAAKEIGRASCRERV